MPAYKDNRQGTWYASFYFENWQGVKQKKLKRGFATKKDALAWERVPSSTGGRPDHDI